MVRLIIRDESISRQILSTLLAPIPERHLEKLTIIVRSKPTKRVVKSAQRLIYRVDELGRCYFHVKDYIVKDYLIYIHLHAILNNIIRSHSYLYPTRNTIKFRKFKLSKLKDISFLERTLWRSFILTLYHEIGHHRESRVFDLSRQKSEEFANWYAHKIMTELIRENPCVSYEIPLEFKKLIYERKNNVKFFANRTYKR